MDERLSSGKLLAEGFMRKNKLAPYIDVILNTALTNIALADDLSPTFVETLRQMSERGDLGNASAVQHIMNQLQEEFHDPHPDDPN